MIDNHTGSGDKPGDDAQKTTPLNQSPPCLPGWIQSVFANAAEGVIAIDIDSKKLSCPNPALSAMFGYSAEEFLLLTMPDLHPVEALPFALAEFEALVRGEKGRVENVTCRRKDGSFFPANIAASPVIIDEKPCLLGFCTDISEHLQTAADLRASEERFRAVIDAARDAIVVMGADGEISLWSPGAEATFGWTADEALGKNVHQLLAPSRYWDAHAKAFPAFQATGKGLAIGKALTLTARHKDGHEFPVELSLSALNLHDRWHAVGILRDITQRKQEEEALRESEEVYRALFMESRDAMMTILPDKGFTSGNPEAIKMFGCRDEKDFASRTPAELSPEYQPDGAVSSDKVREMMMLALETGSQFFEWTHKSASGTEFPATVLLSRIERGGKTILQATVRDITERRQAEKALYAKTELLQLALQAARMGVWHQDFQSGAITSIEGCGTISSLPECVRPKSMEGFFALVHPEDREMLVQHFQRAEEKGEDVESEFRLLLPDGAVRWVVTRGRFSYDSSEKLLSLTGVDFDITERKEAEIARQEALHRQKQLNQLQQALLTPGNKIEKLRMITDGVVDIFGADFCRIWLIQPGDLCGRGCIHAEVKEGPHICRFRDKCLHLMASSGRYTHTDGKGHARVPFGCYKIGLVASGEEHRFLTNDAMNEPRVHNHEWAREMGLVSFAGYQLRVPGGETLGVLALFSKSAINPEEDAQLDALSSTTAQVIRTAEAEEALRESEERYRTVANHIYDWEYWLTPDGSMAYCSPSCERLSGYGAAEFIADPALLDRIIHPDDAAAWGIHRKIGEEESYKSDCRIVTRRGETRWIEHVCASVYAADGRLLGRRASNRDISFRKKVEEEKALLEKQYHQAQKMEAIGQLAGGVAHDFNNLLQIMRGHSEMAVDSIAPDHPLKPSLVEISKAVERARVLVSQLLTFGRRKIIHLEVIDLNELITNVVNMIERILGENIELKFNAAPDIPAVRVDRGMLEQVVINLCVNSRDAMPNGGSLTIETLVERTDDGFREAEAAAPNPYLVIVITDTGCGMDAETQKHIFEPFFTTKELGKGTGLGLASVYGAIQQFGGIVRVSSEVGKGSRFEILLPSVPHMPMAESGNDQVSVEGGTETILLAEDDDIVRNLAVEMLKKAGYTVIPAQNGEEAIEIFKQCADSIDLLLLDMIMPRKGGRATLQAASEIRPDIPALFASGYDKETTDPKSAYDEAIPIIQKPYTKEQLLQGIRKVLATHAARKSNASRVV